MRLIELHENHREYSETARREDEAAASLSFQTVGSKIAHRAAAITQKAISDRLAEGSIGWSEPLKFGVPDGERQYPPLPTRWTPSGFVHEPHIPCEGRE